MVFFVFLYSFGFWVFLSLVFGVPEKGDKKPTASKEGKESHTPRHLKPRDSFGETRTVLRGLPPRGGPPLRPRKARKQGEAAGRHHCVRGVASSPSFPALVAPPRPIPIHPRRQMGKWPSAGLSPPPHLPRAHGGCKWMNAHMEGGRCKKCSGFIVQWLVFP